MNTIKDKISVFRHSFHIRLFAAITGMTIFFIVVTGYFSYLLGRQSVENQIEQYAISTVGQITERVRTYLSQPVHNVGLLKSAIERGFINPSDTNDLIRYFHLMQDKYPEFLNINYGDQTGRFTMVPPQRPEVHKLFDPRIRPWYTGALKKEGLYWTGVYVFASSQHPGITVSTPIIGKDASIEGVCSIDIDLSTFSKFLKTLKIGEKGYAYIIDNDQNRIIAHPELLNLHFNPDRIRFLSAGLASLKAGKKQFGMTAYKGKQFFTAYTDYPESNWSVGVNLPVSDFFENINAIKKATFTLVLVAVFISCLVSYLVALTIVKPLRTLEKGIKRVSTGDLDYKVRLQDPNIVGTLADAFNQMALSLKQSRAELKKTYFKLAEKEKMATLGQLTAGIAHEIKNPLGVILGSAQVVINLHKPDKMRERAGRFIIDEVIRLNKTLKSFLAFARPAPPNRVSTDLALLLDETLDGFASSFKQNHITVERLINGPVPRCSADPDQMRQVFLNIILNAAQAMPEGGVLSVNTCYEHSGRVAAMEKGALSAKATHDGKLIITISDTGVGLTPNQLDKIFEPFATFKDDGTGLGLSIVAQILKLHHADISVESKPGTGTLFTIFLPCSKEGIDAI